MFIILRNSSSRDSAGHYNSSERVFAIVWIFCLNYFFHNVQHCFDNVYDQVSFGRDVNGSQNDGENFSSGKYYSVSVIRLEDE